ncbi:MAG TPA: methyltransferase domain-containing protein [Terriglobia bacterium]|nr:methyltransferase domain-containing protein [Terriglobia bacterium]
MSKKHKEAVQKQFAKTVEVFSKTLARDTAEIMAEKVDFAKPKAGELTLDVACGPGELVLGLAARVGFARGVDLTQAMLLQAREFQRERNILNAGFDRGEAEQLPYPDHAFDLVSCQCSIHHMPKPELALREMVRVMKPEGRMMVIDCLSPESDPKFELQNRIESLRDPSHASTLRLTTFLSIFDALGLEILRQSLKRRERSFNTWMLRAGLEPDHRRRVEARKLLEESIPGDRAGFSAKAQGEDILITHNEGLFLLALKPAS